MTSAISPRKPSNQYILPYRLVEIELNVNISCNIFPKPFRLVMVVSLSILVISAFPVASDLSAKQLCFRLEIKMRNGKYRCHAPLVFLIVGSRTARNLVCTPYLDFGGNLFCQNRSINPRKPIRSHFHSNKIF